MSDPDEHQSPAKSRSSTHKQKARRGRLLHLIWIAALVLGSLWWFFSAKYHAACIAALPIEQQLPEGLVAEVDDFTVTYYGGRWRSGYEPTGVVTLTNTSDQPINLAGRQLFLDFRAGKKLEWQHRIHHWELDVDQLGAKLAGTVLSEFDFAPGAVKKIRIPEGRREFLGDVDRLIVFMPQ